MGIDKYLNFGNGSGTLLKKSHEWDCQTAAISKTGRASDCKAILSKSSGLP